LPDLYLLKLQPPKTKLRAWKYLVDGKSPYKEAPYESGKPYTENDFDPDERESCSKGLSVATLPWCLSDSAGKGGVTFLEVEFTAADIVAVPFATDGKFRVRKFKALRSISRKEAEKILTDAMKLEVTP
jgi:hypothetical protein